MGHPLAPHQARALDFMDSHRVGWIIYEAGTGKTIIALAWIVRALISGAIENALILCPASLVARWWHEVDKLPSFDGFSQFDVDLLKESLTVMSISSVWRTEKRVRRHRDGTMSEVKTVMLRESLERPWGAVIVDESHRLGSHSTNITKACLLLARLAKRRFIMTGTPDCGMYSKLYGQVSFLDPDRWTSWTAWMRQYVTSVDNFRKPRTYDVEACESLKRQYGIVATLDQCFDMPEAIDIDVPCSMTPAVRRMLKDLKKGDVSKHGLTVLSTGTLPMKSYQVVSGFLMVDEGVVPVESSKKEALLDILDGYDGKVVIVCKYHESIRILSKGLNMLGMAFHVFDGESVEPTWQTFQEDDSKAFIVQYQKAIGIDLYAACMMILYEPTFSALELEQTKRRIWRKGQTNTCRYYHLYVPSGDPQKPTLEERTMRSVRAGVDVSSAMLAQWAKEEGFSP